MISWPDWPTIVAILALGVAIASPWAHACAQEYKEFRQTQGLASVLADEIESILLVLPRGQTRAADGKAGDRIWTRHIEKIVSERTVYRASTSLLHHLDAESQFALVKFHTGLAQMPGKREETRIDLQSPIIRDGLEAISRLRPFSKRAPAHKQILDPQAFYAHHRLTHFGEFLSPQSKKHFTDQDG